MAATSRNYGKWLWGGLVGLILLVVLLAAVFYVAMYTEFGSRTVWRVATSVDERLSGEYRAGTLGRGLQLRDVVYQDAERRVTIDQIDADWRLDFSPLKLSVSNLALDTVEVTQLPAPEQPLELPQNLRLPLALDIRQVTLQKLLMRTETATLTFTDIALHASSDGLNHRLLLEKANTPAGLVSMQMQINGDRPFRLSGEASLDSQLIGVGYEITGQVSGSLQRMNVVTNIAAGEAAGKVDIVATPFDSIPFTHASIKASRLDLAVFNASAPKTSLDITAELAPVEERPIPKSMAGLRVNGPISIINRIPGQIDKNLLPIRSLAAHARLDAQAQRLTDITIRLAGDGVLSGSASNRNPLHGTLSLQAQGLNLAALHGALQPTQLAGPLEVVFEENRQQVRLDLTSANYSLIADASIDAQKIVLNSAKLQSAEAVLALSGSITRDERSAYAIKGTLANFNPSLFIKAMNIKAPQPEKELPFKVYQADINGSFQAEGRLQPELAARIAFDINDSTYNELPMSGGGVVNIAGKRVLDSDAALAIAGNRLAINGAFGRPDDRLLVNIDAPALEKLGFGLTGMLQLQGSFAGTLQQPRVDADFKAENLRFGEHRLVSASGEVEARGVPADNSDATLRLDLQAQGYRSELARLDRLSAQINGSYGSHTMRLATAGQVREQKIDLALAAQGRLQQAADGLAWSGMLTQFDNRTLPQIHLAEAASLSIAPGQYRLGEADISIAKARVALGHFAYEAGAISSAGTADALNVAHLLQLREQFTGAAPPIQTDLVLDASWDFRLAQQAEGFVQIQRQSGDIMSPAKTGDIMLDLSQLQARGEFEGNRLNLQVSSEASRIGTLQGQGQIELLSPQAMLTITPESAVQGQIRLSIPQLQKVGVLAGPRISINGRVDVSLDVDGTVGQVQLSGQIDGRDLALTLYDQGVRLRDGIARISLRDNVLQMQQVEFHGGEGTLRITGSIPINDQLATRPDLTANIIADKLQLLADPTSQLTLSGRANISSTGEHYAVNGKFTVDRALFDLPETAAPSLGDDVVIVRESGGSTPLDNKPLAERKASPWSPAIHLDIDLGRQFYFVGRGADLRLAGQVAIASLPGQQPSVRGTVRVAEGTFEAFGAELAIERGIINFQGAMDNPNINILAMRRGQEVAAGVQVTGTATNSRVTLVSEPNVPDDQKLSWLVFGHGGGGEGQSGAQAAAQGAARALVNKLVEGTNIATNLGLDEISIGASDSGEQLVTLGKTITDKLTLGYRQGITGAESAVELTYLLTQHWSVVARGGQVLGINILYSNRFDEIGGKRRTGTRKQ